MIDDCQNIYLFNFRSEGFRSFEGFTEGRLVVSEENLDTTDDGVGRSM